MLSVAILYIAELQPWDTRLGVLDMEITYVSQQI